MAIHGLETMSPFTVKGCLEPCRFLCTVSYWNCYIKLEDDMRYPFDEKDMIIEASRTSMLQFCHYLHNDITQNMDKWVRFTYDENIDVAKRTEELSQKLNYLKKLLFEKEKLFSEVHYDMLPLK